MSYESTAEPIKVGYLMDFTLPPGFPEELFASFTQTFDLVFEEARRAGPDGPAGADDLPRGGGPAQGLGQGGDRRVRRTGRRGLPGGVRSEHHRQLRADCAKRSRSGSRCPAISVTGTDDWLGEWTFAFPQGSMTDEPIFLADLRRQARAHRDRRPGRAEPHRRELPEEPAKCLSAQGHSHRRGGRDRADRAGHQRSRAARCTRRRPRRSCTWASASGSSSSTRRSRPSAGTRRDSPPPRSRTRGSTRSCGTRSWAGSGSTSTTRRTRSARTSSTATRRSTTAVAPSTA